MHLVDILPPPDASDPGAVLTFHEADVTSEREMQLMVADVERTDGPIDYLVTAAAIYPPRPFLELTPEEWSKTLSVNATGTFLACRAVIGGMIARRFGRIVLFSSMLARTGGVNCAAYAASKGAVLGLARAMALEVATQGVRVNTLTPGLTDTPQPRGHLTEEQIRAKAKGVPLGRIGTIEDMVEGTLFLLGEESSFYTGQDLRVNGGSTLW